jgi:hypothetical protein
MKKVFLIISILMLMSVSGTCQWYQRIYGVDNLSRLSQEQLSEAYSWTWDKVTTGKIISAVGAAGITGGFVEILATQNVGEGFGILFGIVAIIFFTPVEITGLTIWGINGSRLDEIEMNMARAKISLGLTNCLADKMIHYPYIAPVPGITLTVSF